MLLSAFIFLSQESPRAVAQEGLVQAKLGTNVTLSCNVMGLPPPVVKWYKTNDDKQHLMSRTTYRKQDRELYFKEVTEADEGLYVCEASNELGKHSAKIVLTIGKW